MGLSNIAHCTFLVARKAGMSYEEFEAEYLKHIPKAVPILKKYSATYYNVQFNSPASKAATAATLGLDAATTERIIQEHDAIATIKFPDLKALKSFMDSKENKEQLAPDGPRIRARLSSELVWVSNGWVLKVENRWFELKLTSNGHH